MNKLFTIEKIEKESEATLKTMQELDKKLEEIQKNFEDKKIDTKTAYLLIKLISGRKEVLTGYNGIVKEMRLILSTLVKEEGKLRGEMARIKAESMMAT